MVTVIMKKILRHNTVNNHKATQIPAFLSSLSLSPPPLPLQSSLKSWEHSGG